VVSAKSGIFWSGFQVRSVCLGKFVLEDIS